MKAIDHKTCFNILQTVGVKTSGPKAFHLGSPSAAGKMDILSVSRFQNLLAAAAVRWISRHDEAVLVITEYGIWPNRENPSLFLALMKGVNCRVVMRANRCFGFRFGSTENGLLQGMLWLCFAFGWGGFLISKQYECSFAFSHDSWIQFPDTHDAEVWQKEFQELVSSFNE